MLCCENATRGRTRNPDDVWIHAKVCIIIETRSCCRRLQTYSRRLVRDLEIKGIVRTAVEGTDLSLHAAHTDILQAECVRTFPTVRFPANELLKREEIETLKKSGVSIIAALHHGHGVKHRMFAEPPIDLMYGFRGNKYDVDLLSPYEMLLWWALARIVPPTRFADCPRLERTPAGRAYTNICQEEKDARKTKRVLDS